MKALICCCALLLSLAAHAQAPAKPLLAIVIDDIGYKRELAEALIALPLDLTFAILPLAPHSQQLAQKAWLNGRELMLHIPMATRAGNRLDAGGLYENMDSFAIQRLLNSHLDLYPRALGINNHMGSRLTEMDLPMRAIMETLAPRQLYFLDSKTSAASVAMQEARRAGLASVQRDIFLDNDPSPAAIQAQLDKALALARQRGFALAIGHPYPHTLAVLDANKDKINATMKVVPASHYMGAISRSERDPRHISNPFWPLHTPWQQGSTK